MIAVISDSYLWHVFSLPHLTFFFLEKGIRTSADANPTMSENKNIFPIKSPFKQFHNTFTDEGMEKFHEECKIMVRYKFFRRNGIL